MSLAKLKKKLPSTVIGVDASTQSFAYCLGKDGIPVEWGIVKYSGKDRFVRALDSFYKVEALMQRIGPVDVIVQEQAVGSVNQRTGLVLAQAYGVTMPSLLNHTQEYVMVTPNEWQANLGVKAKSLPAIKKEFPGQSKSFYSEQSRRERKQRNLDFVKDRFGIELPYEANDTGDAIGIFYSYCKDAGIYG